MPSGLAITQAEASGCGIRLGIIAAMDTDGMIHGTTEDGTDRITDSIAPGTTVGMTIHGTTDGIRLTIARGDGLTTDTTVGTRHTGVTAIMATTAVEAVAVTTTDVLVTQEPFMRTVVQVIDPHIAILFTIAAREWAV